jgi:hypothetical protein
MDDPSTFCVDELTAPQAFSFLLLPELFGEAAPLQTLQHPRAFSLHEVGVPVRIEWVSIRFDSDMSDDSGIRS